MELIDQLVSQLGVQAGQAKGGAGLLFKLAQEKLGGDFSRISAVIPEAADLIRSGIERGKARGHARPGRGAPPPPERRMLQQRVERCGIGRGRHAVMFPAGGPWAGG